MGSILHHEASVFAEGHFVLLCPMMNRACIEAAALYRAQLSNEHTFAVWTLEAFVDALQTRSQAGWVAAIRDRYLNFDRVDTAYRDFYLRQTTRWASKVRADLGQLQSQHGDRVYFRPSSTGFAMVGLLPGKPQLGTGYSATDRLLKGFEVEFARWCDGEPPKRVTPEKALQSFLLSNALAHGRHLKAINAASLRTAAPVDLVFVTDELVIPSIDGDDRLDLLCLDVKSDGDALVLIELKSTRAMKELLRQTAAYAEILEQHRSAVAELASAFLGRPVVLRHPMQKWIIWPATGALEEPREAEFSAAGVRVVRYTPAAGGYDFRVGGAPRAFRD